jgi:hypothetical protein
MRNRKVPDTSKQTEEDEPLLPIPPVDSTMKRWMRRLQSILWVGAAMGLAHLVKLYDAVHQQAHG